MIYCVSRYGMKKAYFNNLEEAEKCYCYIRRYFGNCSLHTVSLNKFKKDLYTGRG